MTDRSKSELEALAVLFDQARIAEWERIVAAHGVRPGFDRAASHKASTEAGIAAVIRRLQPARVPEGWRAQIETLCKVLDGTKNDASRAVAATLREIAAPAAEGANADDVERAAMAVAADWQREQESVVPWADLPEESRELARAQSRVVLAALGKPAAEGGIPPDVADRIKGRIDALAPANNLSRFLDTPAPEPREADHSPGAGNMVPEAGQREGALDIREMYVETHGTDDGWLGIAGSYFISGVQAARRLASAPQPTRRGGEGVAYPPGAYWRDPKNGRLWSEVDARFEGKNTLGWEQVEIPTQPEDSQ